MRCGLRLLTVDDGGAWCRMHTSRKTRHPNPRAMTNRICVLVLLVATYAIGYAGGREQAVQAFTQQSTCVK